METLFLCVLSLVTLTTAPKTKPKEEVIIPIEIQESCEKWGEEYEICPEVLEAMCWQETRCRPELDNGSCYGITQINPNFHKATMEKLGVDDLYDYDQNIHVCAYTIRQYADETEDLYCVLMMWNSGSSRGKTLFEQGKYTSYAIEVSQTAHELEIKHYGR